MDICVQVEGPAMTTWVARLEAALWPPSQSQRSALRKYRTNTILMALIGLFVLAAAWRWIVVTVPAGHVGVMWYRFGGGTDTRVAQHEGTRLVLPWDRLEVYDARVRQISRDFDMLTQDGLMISVNISARFRLNAAMVGFLHQNVGADYVDVLLTPAVGSHARLVFAQNPMESVFSARRVPIQAEIRQAVMADLVPRSGMPAVPDAPWLFVEDVLIRSIRFPPDLQQAINRKMEQFQVKEEYAYRLQREELESKRKEVEAQGIAKFQRIVGPGISSTYLQWKGIDATLALAQSPNAKVVLIGPPTDGLPLILGGAAAAAPNGPERPAEGGSVNASQPTVAPPANAPPGPVVPRPSAALATDPPPASTDPLRRNPHGLRLLDKARIWAGIPHAGDPSPAPPPSATQELPAAPPPEP
jgi:prohibitin 1